MLPSRYTVLGFLAVIASLVHTASALKCGDVTNTTSGALGVPTGLVPNKPCNLTIKRPNNDKNGLTTIQLTLVNIAPGDSMVIYDGKDALLANFTAKTVARKVLVGFQVNTTIVFTPKANKTVSTWSLVFDTQGCQMDLENSWTTNIESPVYVKTSSQRALQCDYTVTSFLPAGHIAAAAFASFNLDGDSALLLRRIDGNISFTNSSTLSDFFAQGSEPLKLTLSITDTRTLQNFTLVVEPVLEECSGDVAINGTLEVNKKFPADTSSTSASPGRMSTCRWLLTSDHLVLHAHVSSLRLATAVAGAGDSLVFRVGGSSRGAVLDSLVTSVDDYLVLTSASSLLVTFSFGLAKGDRELNVTFMDADNGGLLKGEGHLSAGETITEKQVFFSLVATPGQWVEVSHMTDLTNATTVSFYDGAQMSSPLLTVWSSEDQDLSLVTGHDKMLVVLSDLAEGVIFNAYFRSVPAGCDSLASGPSGEMTFSAEVTLTKGQACTWTVAPIETEGTVVLHLDSVQLREKESLIIRSGLALPGRVLANFTGPQVEAGPLPQVYVPAADRFRVTFTRLAPSSPFVGALVQYKTVPQACGGELTKAIGQIRTPNYPNLYPLNALCDWTLGSSKSTSLLLLSFSSLSLAQKHSVAVFRSSGNSSSQPAQLARYGGSSALPRDLILPDAKQLSVAFSSEPGISSPASRSVNQVSGGVSLNYWILECGGNLTAANGSFTSPEFTKAPTKSALCVWILNVADVKGPVNSTNIVSFSIKATGKDAAKVGQYLKIYDGPSLRGPSLPLMAGATNLSRYDSIVVVFNFTFDSSSKTDVRLNFTYGTVNCNSSHLCGNGICMHPDWICNGHDDCGDDSDEQNCVIPPPTPKPPKPAPPQDYSGWVKKGWVPGCLLIGAILGMGAFLLVPLVLRRFRLAGHSNYNRMETPTVA